MASTRLRRIVFLAAVSCAATAAGCGGGASSSTLPATPLPSYLALYPRDDPSAVFFLQWERRGDSADGTLTVVYPTTQDTPESIHPVEGEIDDESVTLDVGTDSDSPQRWEGAQHGRRIVFRVELEDGSVQTLTFVPARLPAYKRAVAKLRAGR